MMQHPTLILALAGSSVATAEPFRPMEVPYRRIMETSGCDDQKCRPCVEMGWLVVSSALPMLTLQIVKRGDGRFITKRAHSGHPKWLPLTGAIQSDVFASVSLPWICFRDCAPTAE
jgi:hypothetical protein